MNQANQGNNSDAPGNVPVKRKRGRPRKDQSLNRGETARVPPGFERVNGNQTRQVGQVEPLGDANNDMVGQVVSGVVEAAFDAGYLLNVRVGNSNTTLRGVVFKPGHYVPISAENDVAPHVQMIRRNEIPLPTENQTQVHGHNPRSRERNGQHIDIHRNKISRRSNESPSSNRAPRVAPRAAHPVASKGKQVPPVAAQAASLVVSRGNVVPVVLQPVNLSNGTPPVNQVPPVATQAAPLVTSRGKQVPAVAPQAAHPLNGSTPTTQLPPVGHQVQPQISHQVTPKGMRNENGAPNQATAEALHEAEAKSMRLPGLPLEDLVGEVIKRVQASSQQAQETQIENSKSAGKLSTKDSGFSPEGEFSNMNQPLLIKPLQAVQPDHHDQSASVPKPLENKRTGKMTELLQVLQENMTENQVPQVPDLATGSRLKLHEQRSPETELGDEETVRSKKLSRASSF